MSVQIRRIERNKNIYIYVAINSKAHCLDIPFDRPFVLLAGWVSFNYFRFNYCQCAQRQIKKNETKNNTH